MQNFRSSTAHVKFQQICTLTGFFCWKYMKFLLKWYRGITSHDTEEWCKIRRKTDLFFLKKMARILWILIRELKSLKSLHFISSLSCKVCNVWPKKVQRSIFHDSEESFKIWRETNLWFRKWHEKFSKFSPERVRKFKNYDFDGILLSKVENPWA